MTGVISVNRSFASGALIPKKQADKMMNIKGLLFTQFPSKAPYGTPSFYA